MHKHKLVMKNVGEKDLQQWQFSKLILNGVEIMRVETLEAKDTMFYYGRQLATALKTQMHISNTIEAV